MSAASPLRNAVWWHVAALVSVSAAYRSLFVHHGIGWLFDEGWPLYAAMQLHAGAVLYRDVLFPFPPGHLLVAWIAWALDPPGIVLARVLYAAFDVALCVAFYFLGRRLCTPPFAFLGALLLAVAAPRSQLAHLLFGYRYLVFSVGVLILLDARLRLGQSDPRRARRLLLGAGVLTGVALWFRLTPAFAVGCAVGLALVACGRAPRVWVRDAAAYAAGLALVLAPIALWFAWGVGLDVVFREVVTRIVALQSAQSLASPPFTPWPPMGDRDALYRWWVAFQYRLYIGLYAGHALGLGVAWWRAWRRDRRFEHGLLLAVVVWGAIYLLRTLGRSDDHHLMSALPPVLLVIVHALEWGTQRLIGRLPAAGASDRARAAVVLAVGGATLVAWVHLQRVDLFLRPELRGTWPLASTGGRIRVTRPGDARGVDAVVAAVRAWSAPDELLLDLTGSPLLHPLSDRRGPGRIDVISPGIFLSPEEEAAFVAHVAARPPAVVVWPARDFDRRGDRGIESTAPQLARWVRAHYREAAAFDRYRVLRPVQELEPPR